MSDEHSNHGDAHFHGAGSGPGASPECAYCPVCVLLQAVTTSRPEVTGHLLAAGRELSLALAAALEASAETFGRAATAHAERSGAAEADPASAPPTATGPQRAHAHTRADPPRLRRIPVE